MRKSLLLLVLFMLPASSAVYAQVGRLLPADAELGRTTESQLLPNVKIGSRILRLAPGAVIYDQQNRSIVHASLPVNADVLYVRNQAGDIQRMYILNDNDKLRLEQARRH